MHPYIYGVVEKIQQATKTQEKLLEDVAEKLANRVEKGGLLYILGTGHSHMIAEEVFYRAGGPIFVYPILEPELMLHHGAFKSTQVERMPGYAEIILQSLDLREQDMFLVVSNSGRNPLPIEAALYMKEKGVYTVSLTSFSHSQSVQSRHKSGKRLFEVTDIALDNCGEVGDAFLTFSGSGSKYGPSSSVVGITLIQTIISMALEKLVNRGYEPPIFQSANLDHTDEKNEQFVEQFRARIPMLR